MTEVVIREDRLRQVPGLVSFGPREGFLPEHAGIQAVFRFPNGYGASIILGYGTHGVELALIAWELPTDPDDEFGGLWNGEVEGYEDTVGWLDEPELIAHLERIQALPARNLQFESAIKKVLES